MGDGETSRPLDDFVGDRSLDVSESSFDIRLSITAGRSVLSLKDDVGVSNRESFGSSSDILLSMVLGRSPFNDDADVGDKIFESELLL
jgi:hypothetical protein